MSMRTILAAVFLSLTMSACCGSGADQQESSYRSRVREVDALIVKADATTKVQIEAKKAAIEADYAKLPSAQPARGEALGKINQELNRVVGEFGPKVVAQGKASADAEANKLMGDLVGTWIGSGMKLVINADRSVSYEKKTANTSKNFDGTLDNVTPTSFDVKVLAISTTFKIDVKPHDDAGKRKMTVDGVEVTRQLQRDSSLQRAFCRNSTESPNRSDFGGSDWEYWVGIHLGWDTLT